MAGKRRQVTPKFIVCQQSGKPQYPALPGEPLILARLRARATGQHPAFGLGRLRRSSSIAAAISGEIAHRGGCQSVESATAVRSACNENVRNKLRRAL